MTVAIARARLRRGINPAARVNGAGFLRGFGGCCGGVLGEDVGVFL